MALRERGQFHVQADGMNRVLGHSVERLEDRPLLTGRARFVDDIVFPDMLHAAFLRSDLAHARIGALDLAAARQLAGAHAVWTAADVAPHVGDILLRTALPSPAFKFDLHRPILAGSETVHVGEAIAMAVAKDRATAEDALDLVEADFEALPVVSDMLRALDADSPPAHLGAPHNVAAEFDMAYGDCAAAIANAPHVFRERLIQHRGVAQSMECRGVAARYDPIDERLTVWSSTQTPHACKRLLCELLRMDEDRVRVVTPDVGGGFGPKLVFYPEELLVALAAIRLRRPVKWIEDRREHFISTTQERDQIWDMEFAVDNDGRILAIQGTLLHDHGAYTPRGVNVPYGSASALTLAYVVPNYKLNIKCVVTNRVSVTPIRGAGQPQAVFVMERLLDRAARALNIDRAEIRRRNLVPSERIPYRTPMKTRGGMQIALDSGDYPRCMELSLDHANWDGFRVRQAEARARGRHIGIGVANYVEGTGRGPFEPVSVRVGENGRIHIASGAAAMGQSTRTMLAQVVAEQLGYDMGNIVVAAGDTGAIDLGMGGFNSRQAVMAGASAHEAATQVRKKALFVASHMLDVGEQALEIEGSEIRLKGGGPSVSLAQVARGVAGLPGYYMPGGVEPGLAATAHVIIDEMTYANGSAIAEVEVDVQTGRITVRRIVFAHDCGAVMHPAIVDGQVVGGIVHGIGNALYERMGFDDSAQPTTTTLADYLLMTAGVTPPSIELLHMESKSRLNALGVKGVGESGVIPMTAAIASAVEDALSPFGVRVTQTPIAPQDVIALVRQALRKAY
jgi:carbon-monoxide dehydrogenase large subunit